MLSQGTPMLAHGDEMGRTQQGNNNVYCQDSELSWMDWTLAETNADLVEFTKRAIALRAKKTRSSGVVDSSRGDLFEAAIRVATSPGSRRLAKR